MNLGSIPMAPFVGDQFAALYLGATRVPTVPGKPDVDGYFAELTGGSTFVDTPADPDDGGSAITGRAWYIDGVLTTPATDVGSYVVFTGDLTGAEIRVAAVNAIGTGPRSEPYQFL